MARQYSISTDPHIAHISAFDSSFHWNAIDFGPFYIPTVGRTIELNPQNFKLYHKQIVYETRATIRIEDSLVYINDTLTRYYKFRHNWYFMAGDNMIKSEDSRFFGLVPHEYIIGKASMVLSSKDMRTGKRRWNRMFKRIK